MTNHFQLRTRNSIRGFVRPSVGWLVGWSVGRSVTLESKSGKTHISAPAHPSATDGLYLALFMAVFMNLNTVNINLSDYSKPQFSEKKKKNIAMTESKGRITAHSDQ